MDLLREQLQHAAGMLALLGVQSKSLEATTASRVLRFHPPSERFLTDAAFHESSGRLDPSSRRFAVSLARFSAKNSWPESICWEYAIKFQPGLAFGSKKCARHLPSIFCLFALLLGGLYTRLNRHGFPFCALFQSLQYHC